MFKKLRKNEKGFTLAELLIVVAIIGVLVAISIPIFTSQLKKAHLATNQANARAAYAAVSAELLSSDRTSGKATYTVSTAKIGNVEDAGSALSITAAIDTWTFDSPAPTGKTNITGIGTKTATEWTVQIDDNGNVTFNATGLS